MKTEMLPHELIWEQGHASDVALGAMADGEVALIPGDLVSHVDACEACTHRLGEAALFSAGLGAAIQAMGPLNRLSPVPAAQGKRRTPLPLPMMAAAAVIAVLGAAPTLLHLPARLVGFFLTMLHTLPTLSHGGMQLARNGLGPAGVTLTFVTAAVLIMVSVGLTRLLPRPAASR